MFKITERDVLKYHKQIVARAKRAIKKKDVKKACKELINAAVWAYKFNAFYSDKDSEEIIQRISQMALPEKYSNFGPRQNALVFYDSFAIDNRGLTQQYIHALIELNVEFLFIFENKNNKLCKDIEKKLKIYSKATVFELSPQLSSAEKIKAIWYEIIKYKPSKVLLHIAPWSVEALAAFNGLPQIIKYNINLTDHAYWLGASIIDYNIEFRDYGATVSVQKRGLKKEQLLKLPYYPITKQAAFDGFPEIVQNKVVIFSGGAFYKIYGEKELYFEIVKRLLVENSNTVLLYAGEGDDRKFKKFIRKNNLQERIVLLGYRKDINEVFKKCDLYLGTYPICGGLMSQYAAVNGKPILAYTNAQLMVNQIEGIVCHSRYEKITHCNLSDFYKFADYLSKNKNYRDEIGNRLKKCVISVDGFTRELKNILDNNANDRTIETNVPINYMAFSNLYLDVENYFKGNARKLIAFKYKHLTPLLFPRLFVAVVFQIISEFFNYFYKKICSDE